MTNPKKRMTATEALSHPFLQFQSVVSVCWLLNVPHSWLLNAPPAVDLDICYPVILLGEVHYAPSGVTLLPLGGGGGGGGNAIIGKSKSIHTIYMHHNHTHIHTISIGRETIWGGEEGFYL